MKLPPETYVFGFSFFRKAFPKNNRKMFYSLITSNMDDLNAYIDERGIELSPEQKNKIVVWLKDHAWKSLPSVPRNKYYGLFYEKDKSVIGQTMYHCRYALFS